MATSGRTPAASVIAATPSGSGSPVLVVDAKTGVHPMDARVVDLLREAEKPWLLVANKVDDPRSTDFYEFYRLGAGEPIPVSAINGKNSGDLLDVIVDEYEAKAPVLVPLLLTAAGLLSVDLPRVRP